MKNEMHMLDKEEGRITSWNAGAEWMKGWPMKKQPTCLGALGFLAEGICVLFWLTPQAARGMVENKASRYNYGEKRYVYVQVDPA